MFTENDTNFERLWGGENASKYVKDAFHDHIIPSHRPPVPETYGSVTEAVKETVKSAAISVARSLSGEENVPNGRTTPTQEQPGPPSRHFINPENKGTKSGAHYTFKNVPGRGGVAVVRLKLTPNTPDTDESINDEEIFDDIVDERRREADEFYARLVSGPVTDDLKAITRQALGGMLWLVLLVAYNGHTSI